MCEAVPSELRVGDGELEVQYEDGQRLVKRSAEGSSEDEGRC